VRSLAGGERKVVASGGRSARYLPATGHLLYVLESDLFGVAFDLSYPTGQLTFAAADEGPFLAQGADVVSQVVEISPGRLVVGLSRLGQVPGVDGTGVLLILDFAVGANGSGDLTFSDNQAFDADGSVASGISWSGGTVRINR